jgi:hypothetical protein
MLTSPQQTSPNSCSSSAAILNVIYIYILKYIVIHSAIIHVVGLFDRKYRAFHNVLRDYKKFITRKPKDLLYRNFHSHRKTKKRFFDNWRCSMCEPRVTRHSSIRYSSSCYSRVNMGASIFFIVRPTIATWPRWTKGTDHAAVKNVDAPMLTRVTRTWISYRCVSCHPW